MWVALIGLAMILAAIIAAMAGVAKPRPKPPTVYYGKWAMIMGESMTHKQIIQRCRTMIDNVVRDRHTETCNRRAAADPLNPANFADAHLRAALLALDSALALMPNKKER